ALLKFALEQTAPLSSFSLLPLSVGTSGPDKFELACASDVYALLMYVPLEYLTRTSRADSLQLILLPQPAVVHSVDLWSFLVCLRRDIVMDAPSHLISILHKLPLMTRRARSQAGAKQSKLVVGTLPPWVFTFLVARHFGKPCFQSTSRCVYCQDCTSHVEDPTHRGCS
ncbi:hypothetical protein EDD16DRAFT_1650783, partial [Pisolithus croceorrhizus]